MKESKFENVLKILFLAGATVSFIWGVIVYVESHKVESTRPFLEKQMAMYSEITKTVATIATSSNRSEIGEAKSKFWKLYWGELALVENRDVERAMKNFGEALKANASQDSLKTLAFQIVIACRYSLDKSWGINAWSNPDKASEKAVPL